MRVLPGTTLLALAAAALLAAGCGSSNNSNGFSPTTDGGMGSDATADSGGDDGGSLIGSEGGLGTATSIAISPANSTLTVTSLTKPQTEILTARVTYSGGNTATMPASWTVDRPDIASITSGGVITPSGATFGKINVTATVGSLTAKTTVTVALALTVTSPSVPV
jgi:hypothetical protein